MDHGLQEAAFEPAQARTAEQFLGTIEAEAALPPHTTPVEAAVVTTGALLERLTAGQAHDLVSALPEDVRPFFERCYADREGRPIARFGRAELVDRVAGELAVAPAAAERITAVVFHALTSVLPRAQVNHVAQQLPRDLQHLWLSPALPPTEELPTEPELLRQLLDEIEASGTLPRRVSARTAFSGVMCLFAQRLSGGQTKHLLLGLPRTIRPLVQRCLPAPHESSLTFGSDELIANVATNLETGLDEAGAIVKAVFAAVKRVLPREEIDHVSSQLPDDLRRVWAG